MVGSKSQRSTRLSHGVPTFLWITYVTQYNKRYILSTFAKIEILYYPTEDLTSFPVPWYQIHKNWSDTFENTSFTKCEFPLFSLYFTHCFAHYLRISLAGKMSLLLYWVTYFYAKYSDANAAVYTPNLASWCFAIFSIHHGLERLCSPIETHALRD